MKKTIQTKIDLPFEEGKTYLTKFQTGEKVLLNKINWREFKEEGVMVKKMVSFKVTYETRPHLGVCPLSIDRLYTDTTEGENIDVCSKCGEKI